MKSFNKISSIIFCWIALNINICYCTNNGNIINEDLGHTTTNKLLQISNKLFTSNYEIYEQNKNNIKHEMEQFICQINDFFNNNFDNDNLEKLIDIVYLNADYDRIINNMKKLYNNNIFNQDEYKELLKFILSIHIMCYIETLL